MNQAALQQLRGITPAAPAIVAQPAVARPPVHKVPPHHTHHAKPATPRPAPAKPAPVPAPPQTAALPATPAAKPPKPETPKPAIPALVKIEFGPGSAVLPASAASALKPFCASPMAVPVIARAPADPSDPSSAMRLSMARAFAIRDALTACGVPSQNIIPRAAGTVPGADNNEAQIGASAKP